MQPVNLDEYEEAARAKLPQAAFDFIAGGAEGEVTLRRNVEAFRRIQLRPRVLVDTSRVELETMVIGLPLGWPVLLAPVAYQKLAHAEGELASARAAAETGTTLVLSCFSNCSIEEVAQAVVPGKTAPRWFQLYFQADREVTKQLLHRAEASGFSAIVLTVDVPQLGHRERDLRNQLQLPPGTGPANLLQNVDLSPYQAMDPGLASQTAGLLYPGLTWSDVDWLRSVTSLPLLLKGVLTAEDAALAVEHGVQGIIVSNHGGRQLDGVPAAIEVLPEVVEAAGSKADVLLDSGIRRGTDVLKALALGAKAVLLGRPYVYGMAVDGEAGVRRVIELLRAELALAMSLAGVPSVGVVTRDLVRLPSSAALLR